MQDLGIIAINRTGIFTLQEARQVIPVIRKITQEYSQKVDQLIARVEALDSNNEMVYELENEINELIKQWHEKIKKLGALPKGLWLVDMDSGDGYFCWKFPETNVDYWHTYDDGYTGRIPVTDWVKRQAASKKVSSQPLTTSL